MRRKLAAAGLVLLTTIALASCVPDVREAMVECKSAGDEFWQWVEVETGVSNQTEHEREYFCAQWVDDDAAGFQSFWDNTPHLSD